jgi:hypothetical protein
LRAHDFSAEPVHQSTIVREISVDFKNHARKNQVIVEKASARRSLQEFFELSSSVAKSDRRKGELIWQASKGNSFEHVKRGRDGGEVANR